MPYLLYRHHSSSTFCHYEQFTFMVTKHIHMTEHILYLCSKPNTPIHVSNRLWEQMYQQCMRKYNTYNYDTLISSSTITTMSGQYTFSDSSMLYKLCSKNELNGTGFSDHYTPHGAHDLHNKLSQLFSTHVRINYTMKH